MYYVYPGRLSLSQGTDIMKHNHAYSSVDKKKYFGGAKMCYVRTMPIFYWPHPFQLDIAEEVLNTYF